MKLCIPFLILIARKLDANAEERPTIRFTRRRKAWRW